MTFLIVLLTGLYEPQTQREVVNCIAHPFESMLRGPIILPITPLPSTLSLLIINTRMIGTTNAAGRVYGGKNAEAESGSHSRQISGRAGIASNLKRLSSLEQENEQNIDLMAGLFGNIMAEIFA